MFQIEVVEKIRTHILFYLFTYFILFYFFNCTCCEIIWKNVVLADRP